MIILKKIRDSERGFSVVVQMIFYVYAMFVLLALVYDFGNVAYVSQIAASAAQAAAQDAAKNIDRAGFLQYQEVRLAPDAAEWAQVMLNDLTEGRVQVRRITLYCTVERDVIELDVVARAATPLLGSLFGLQGVEIPITVFAEPVYGISTAGSME